MDRFVCSFSSIIYVWTYLVYFNTNAASVDEYCLEEVFNPKCSSNEVIVMEHALYGRMKVGRCVNVNIGLCSQNVLTVIDKMCSGQKVCKIEIPNRDLERCTKEYAVYLEASYFCSPVINPHSSCSSSYTIPVTSRITGIASSISKNSKCGLPSAPWSLQAKTGQIINITMIDFSWTDSNEHSHKQCPVKYGYVIDAHTESTMNAVIDICGNGPREKQIYISKGNLVQIIFEEQILQEYSFLLQAKAIGCPDFNPPRNSWMRKEPNKVTIGCHGSSDHWDLICQGTRWIGNYDSCPEEMPVSVNNNNRKTGLPNVVSLSLIGGLTVVICCVAVTSIIVCFCYRKYKIEKPEPEYYTTALTTGNSTLPIPNGTIVSYKTYRPVSTVDNRQTLASRRSTNMHIPFQTDTLRGQIINTAAPAEGSNIIDEVIYDDPANLDINNALYMNQFNSLNSTGTGTVNSLQYTKLQKQRC